MKFIHLSDLHLGKRLHEASLLEDQRDILQKILEVIRDEAPEGVIIAGDVYDKAIPSVDAVNLFDHFLVELARMEVQVYIISGNHDSADRLAFGGRIMETSGIHLSPVYNGTVEPLVLEDEYGPLNLYLLPFLKPAHVRSFFPDDQSETYDQALERVIRELHLDTSRRNVLVTHQFVAGASRCDSEELTVGGTDGISVSRFDNFDYVALGHLHGPQKVGRPAVRYCGSPLKYSFSEADQKKSVTVVELGPKGEEPTIRTLPLTPLHGMQRLCGTYAQLTDPDFLAGTTYAEDYVQITLTDEDDIPDAVMELRKRYHNLLQLSYDNTRTRSRQSLLTLQPQVKQDPLEVLESFFHLQNNQPMNDDQLNYAKKLMTQLKEEEVEA